MTREFEYYRRRIVGVHAAFVTLHDGDNSGSLPYVPDVHSRLESIVNGRRVVQHDNSRLKMLNNC